MTDPAYRPDFSTGNKRQHWQPEYRTADGDFYGVPNVELNECPVSFITDETIDLIQNFGRASHAHSATGAALYGPDLSEWPAADVDAVITLEIERVAAENARLDRESMNSHE